MWKIFSFLVVFVLLTCALLLPLSACGSSTNTGATGIKESNGKPITDANTAVAYLLALRLVRYNMATIGHEPVGYTRGRLTSVGTTKLTYDSEGRITHFGEKPIIYNEGLIESIGSTKITHDNDYPQRVAKIGNEEVTYNSQGLANNVGPSKLSYDEQRRAIKVGEVSIVYKDSQEGPAK